MRARGQPRLITRRNYMTRTYAVRFHVRRTWRIAHDSLCNYVEVATGGSGCEIHARFLRRIDPCSRDSLSFVAPVRGSMFPCNRLPRRFLYSSAILAIFLSCFHRWKRRLYGRSAVFLGKSLREEAADHRVVDWYTFRDGRQKIA